MTGGAGRCGMIVVTQYPGTVFVYVHTVGLIALFSRKKGDPMFRFFIDLFLGMVRTQMTFAAIFRLTCPGCGKIMFGMTCITNTFGAVRIDPADT